MARLLLLQGHLEAAEAAFGTAERAYPLSVWPLVGRVWVELNRDQLPDTGAAETLSRALEVQRNSEPRWQLRDAHFVLGELRLTGGDTERARAEFEAAAALDRAGRYCASGSTSYLWKRPKQRPRRPPNPNIVDGPAPAAAAELHSVWSTPPRQLRSASPPRRLLEPTQRRRRRPPPLAHHTARRSPTRRRSRRNVARQQHGRHQKEHRQRPASPRRASRTPA